MLFHGKSKSIQFITNFNDLHLTTYLPKDKHLNRLKSHNLRGIDNTIESTACPDEILHFFCSEAFA